MIPNSEFDLVPSEISKVEGRRIAYSLSGNLAAPRRRDPPSLGRFDKYVRTKIQRVTGEVIETEAVIGSQVSRLSSDQNARMHLSH